MIETVFKLTCMALLFCGARCFSLSKVFIRGTRLTMKASSHNIAANTVIVLSGATSVGKSAVAMELCRILDGEIVSADSVQVYKRLDIAANKPTAEEQQSIRHHVIDVTDPSNQLSTGDFSRLASQAVRDIISRGKVPVVVGGSTMWMQWLVHGVPDAPKATEEVVTQVEDLIGNLESARDWEKGLEVLRGHDPQRAEQIERNDWYRLRRSLEIALSLRKGNNSSHDSGDENSPNKLTGLRKPVLDEFDLRTFFLTEDREELFHTIDRRCVKMLQNGMMNEIVSLIVEGHLKPEFPVSRSIGYRQGIEYLVSERTSEGKLEYFEEFLRYDCLPCFHPHNTKFAEWNFTGTLQQPPETMLLGKLNGTKKMKNLFF